VRNSIAVVLIAITCLAGAAIGVRAEDTQARESGRPLATGGDVLPSPPERGAIGVDESWGRGAGGEGASDISFRSPSPPQSRVSESGIDRGGEGDSITDGITGSTDPPLAGRVEIPLLDFGSDADDGMPPPFEFIGPASPPTEPAIYLPPLEQELAIHGGSYLNESIDSIRARHEVCVEHPPAEYLPENWWGPQPIALPYNYLGSNAIPVHPCLKWCGPNGSMWEPRLVVAGGYQVFAAAYQQGHEQHNGIGHQLLVDIDLRLTGTERFHVEFRPFGRKNTGGSFYQFNNPAGYIDNSTGVPQRFWFEGELQSILGGLIDNPRPQLDVNFVVGKFPFALHNALLINDEVLGIVLAKNYFISSPLSNLNTQVFYAPSDVDSAYGNTGMAGIHFLGDYRHALIEATYAHVFNPGRGDHAADYGAFSLTQLFGPLSVAGRVMFKEGDRDGIGNGQLYVLETNFSRIPPDWLQDRTGIELTVSYLNLFKATSGWSPISGANFNRLENLFTLNPLLNIAAGLAPTDTTGAAAGVQMFCHHQDASLTPEIAVEDVSGHSAWGIGLVGQRKLCPRTYLELRGLKTWSNAPMLRRDGAFASLFVIF
jgi:hypothetical protein